MINIVLVPVVKVVPLWVSRVPSNRKISNELAEVGSDPYSLFISTINSPLTEYLRQLNKFFEFVTLKGTIEQEKDEDIKRELRKGNIVEIIESSLDY